MQLIFSESEIVAAAGGPLDSGDSINWAMGRSVLGLTVDTLVDEADGRIDDGDISLRDAIAAAAPGELIEFDALLNGGTILLSRGELALTRSVIIDATELDSGLVIDAAGNDPTPGQRDGEGSRILNVDDGNLAGCSSITVRGLTLTGGDINANGGAIRSFEMITIASSTISGNAANSGGGIFGSHVRIYSSTISGNSATGVGGGVYGNSVTTASSTISGNSAQSGGGIGGGIVTAESSTVFGNSAERGGGAFARGSLTLNFSNIVGNNGGGAYGFRSVMINSSTISRNSGRGVDAESVTVISSTISENAAPFAGGGGIFANNVMVDSSTIAGNLAGFAGGIWAIGGPANIAIKNSVVSGNSDDGRAPDIARGVGTLTVEFSLIGDNTGSGLSEAPFGSPDANGNLIGGPMGGVIDPLLGPLADNGGPTLTHALLPGSPAIHAGDPAAMAGVNGVPLYDQRGEGFSRVAGGRIDVGAFEMQSLKADFDKDGDTDGNDFLIWQAGFSRFSGDATPNQGDANGDGNVDGDDFLMWQAEFGSTAPAGAGGEAAPAPILTEKPTGQSRTRNALAAVRSRGEASAVPRIRDQALTQFEFARHQL